MRRLGGKPEQVALDRKEQADMAQRETSTVEEVFGPVVSRYTREQALADGVLVDVTERARDAGFRFPVAVSRKLWDQCIVPSDEDRKAGQSEEGRLWDVLVLLYYKAVVMKGDIVHFGVAFRNHGTSGIYILKAVCGPGDHGEPAITIMMSDED